MKAFIEKLAALVALRKLATPGPWVRWAEHADVYAGTAETENEPHRLGNVRVKIADCEIDLDYDFMGGEEELDIDGPYDGDANADFIEAVGNFDFEGLLTAALAATPAPAAPLADAELQAVARQHAALVDYAGSPYDVRQISSVVGEVWGIWVEGTSYLLAGDMKRVEADAVCDQLNALPGLLARLAAAARWVSVGERLPEAHELVLIARPIRHNFWNTIATGYYDNGGWYAKHEDYDGDDLLDQTVTHWQHLPAAPTTNAGKEPGQC